MTSPANGPSIAPAAEGPFPCFVCEEPVWRTPSESGTEWFWTDASGSATAPRESLRWRYTPEGDRVPWLVDTSPYARLAELSAVKRPTRAQTMEYTALRIWEQLGTPGYHLHRIWCRYGPGWQCLEHDHPRGPEPVYHCGRVGWLAPVGWICRSCKLPIDTPQNGG